MNNLLKGILIIFTLCGCQAGDVDSEDVSADSSIKLNMSMYTYIEDFDQFEPTKNIIFKIRIFADDSITKSQIKVNGEDVLELIIDDDVYDISNNFERTSSATGFSSYVVKLNNVDWDIKKIKVNLEMGIGTYQARYTIEPALQVTNYSKKSGDFDPRVDDIDLAWSGATNPTTIAIQQTAFANNQTQSCLTLEHDYTLSDTETSALIVAKSPELRCPGTDNIAKISTEVLLEQDYVKLAWDSKSFNKSSFEYKQSYQWQDEWLAQ